MREEFWKVGEGEMNKEWRKQAKHCNHRFMERIWKDGKVVFVGNPLCVFSFVGFRCTMDKCPIWDGKKLVTGLRTREGAR